MLLLRPQWSGGRGRGSNGSPGSEYCTKSGIIQNFCDIGVALLCRVASLVNQILKNSNNLRILEDRGFSCLALHLCCQQNHEGCLGVGVECRRCCHDCSHGRMGRRLLLVRICYVWFPGFWASIFFKVSFAALRGGRGAGRRRGRVRLAG